MRIGHGFDAHPFEKDRKLILGGVHIPYSLGMAGHSDGDVVVHALCDAILGAASLGDIGQHFPNSAEFKDVDSRVLLRNVIQKIKSKNLQVSNVDITIVAQEPKLVSYFKKIRELLAADLEISDLQINIKATTTDHMGFTGRKEGIASFAVALLTSNNN